MHVKKIDNHIHLIDLEIAETGSFIASYVLRGRNVAIIETGPTLTVPNLLSGLEELDVKPDEVAYVLVSHIHLDHGGGAGRLLKHLSKAKLIVHRRGVPHMANPERLWAGSKEALEEIAEVYGRPEPVPRERIVAATDGMTIDVGDDVKLKVVETLGHASHHLSYYEPLSKGIFTGDAAGVYISKFDVILPTTPPIFRLDMTLASLKKLISLRPKHLYYSHFGKADNAVERLERYVEQLKLWAAVIKRGVERGEDLKAIGERILESDKSLQKVAEYIKEHPVLGKTVFNQSIRGFVDFVRKSGC